jgi:hypothetical protein
VAAGACYGYGVRSSLDFTYLREGGGDPFDVVEHPDTGKVPDGEPVLEWTPRPEHPFHARVYERGGTFDVWIDGMGTFHVDPDASHVSVPADAEPVRREERLWGIPAALCFTRRGDVALHAAAVEVDGRAILLTAPGRFGKTTLATAFLQRGHRVLAEDLACCRVSGSDHGPVVFPGPSVLRVRRDVYDHFGSIDGTSVVADDPERVHLAMEDRLRGSADPVPIAAVVVLRRSSPGIRLERAEATALLPDLWTVSFNLPIEADRTRCFAGIVDLVDAVPTWTLDRPLSYGSLSQVLDDVSELARAPGAAGPHPHP